MEFKWHDRYSVGVEVVDEQHKKLVEMINHLSHAIIDNQTNHELERLLQELVDYTNYHFSTEEKIFLETHYPNKDAHLLQHKEFFLRVKQFQDRADQGIKGVSIDLMEFLYQWLIGHIMGPDKTIGKYYEPENN